MSLKNKLNRMKSHMNLEIKEKLKTDPVLTEDNKSIEFPFREKWKQFQVEPYTFDGQFSWLREVRYPLDTQHGDYKFEEINRITDLWNHANLDHPLSAKGLGSNDLFFFDTETTGLGGGAGNTIFILGYAFIEGSEVVVKQHILPRPGNEIPLYQSFLESINYETLVTYNGKAFDWPQLKTRHTLIKDHVPRLPEFGHFDLYHASRRLWKHKLERVKLSAVETDILGFKRENDIPGYLAPMIYFDFVERQDPEILFGIIKHNELDVLSLITLYIHLSKQILQTDGYGAESLEIARWLSYLGKKDDAYKTYQTVVAEGSEEERLIAKHAIAFEMKKAKKFDHAFELWKEVVEIGTGKQRLEASIECAKLLEHQYKSCQEAYLYSTKAVEMVSKHLVPASVSMMNDLDKRIQRLERKMSTIQ